MPLFAGSLLFFTMANIALPGTSSFIGEFLLLLGTYKYNAFCALISAISVILSGAYSLWLTNRILFGNIKTNYILEYNDISKREFYILLPLFIFVFLLGINPNILAKYIQISYIYIIFFFNFLNQLYEKN